MEKLILTSLGIIAVSLLFLTFMEKENDLNSKNENHYVLEIKKNNSELRHLESEKKRVIASVSPNNTSKVLTNSSKNQKQSEREAFALSYFNYRKEQHQLEQKKMRQYLAYQKELKHIREGGVKSQLEREKSHHEVQFQRHYTSMMMSQKNRREYNFMKQNREMQKRRERMHSLRERQILQTKYRGEL